jgi:hypothetical protein
VKFMTLVKLVIFFGLGTSFSILQKLSRGSAMSLRMLRSSRKLHEGAPMRGIPQSQGEAEGSQEPQAGVKPLVYEDTTMLSQQLQVTFFSQLQEQ